MHKRDRDHLRDVAPNDGRHLHAFALTPPFGRGGRALEDIVNNDQRFLVGGAGSLFRVHAVPVVVNPHVVVDYALKGLRSGRVSDEEVFVLPRLREEVI